MNEAPAAATTPVRQPAPARSRDGNRLLTVGALVIAAVWAVAVTSWHPDGFRAGLLLRSVPFALALPALVASVIAGGGVWRRPAHLTPAGGSRLRAPAGPALGWFVAAEILVLVSLLVPVLAGGWFADPEAPEGVRYALLALDVALVGVTVLLVGTLALGGVHGRPHVDLTPSAIEVRDLFGRWTIPWEAVRPGTPARQTSGRVLRLTVDRPELVTRRGLTLGTRTRPTLTLTWLRVHPWFLADALRWFVDQPEQRAGIGTPEGCAELRRALGQN
ncbi:PH domain-containing protein [Micromonospora endolithica]|nr:PH domain-containing protein [Micromonospora endolithica]